MFIDEIAVHLVGKGIGSLGTTIFTSSKAVIPAGDGPYLTITETGGSGPTRRQNISGAATQRPTAQIVVRALSYVVARAMAKAAYQALDGIWNETLSGAEYVSVVARQEPTDIGVDGAGRAMVSFNIDCEKAPS
jgi:hypothetical protein